MAADVVTITLPPDASPELIERLRSAFPDASLSPEAGPVAPAEAVADAEDALVEAFAAAPALPQAAAEWLSVFPGGGWGLALTCAAVLGGAYLIERGVRRLVPAAAGSDEVGAPFRIRAVRGARWLAGRALGLALFAVAALALWRLIAPSGVDLRGFGYGLLGAVLYTRGVYAMIQALAAPDAPGRRLMGLTDAEARVVGRASLILMVVSLGSGALRAALDAAAGFGPETELARMALIALGSGFAVWFFLAISAPIGALIDRAIGEDRAATPRVVLWVARRWALAFAAVALVDLLMKDLAVMGLLGPDAVRGSGRSLLILTLTPLIVAGLRVWRAETEDGQRGLSRGAFALAEGLVIVGGGVLLMRAWGVDPFAPQAATGVARLLPGLVEAAVVAVGGFALWRALAAVMTPAEPVAGARDEEGQRAAGRLATILPVLRGFALAVIGVVTLMTALTALGVNIAPLLASAGIVGLAIGFGAQRLVADVISGLLYLYEDAFRVGEYVETGSGKGMVERISLRSVRLRHPRGPVYTIPFSAMGTVQNHSRDWVTMKFTFAVPSETDLEMVRKLVKKVGEALAADPDIKDNLLEPLKSQGALSIQGSSYVVGCKFTAKPGQQFLIRRKAFAALQKALDEKGIELFTPQMTLAADAPGGLAPATAGGGLAAPQ